MAGEDPATAAVTNDPQLAVMAAQVIDASRYFVLATADQHGVPWVSPLRYAHAGYRDAAVGALRAPADAAAGHAGRR